MAYSQGQCLRQRSTPELWNRQVALQFQVQVLPANSYIWDGLRYYIESIKYLQLKANTRFQITYNFQYQSLLN